MEILKENAFWIKEILSQLKSQFGIQQFNFVGHSMGNMSFAFYMKKLWRRSAFATT